MKERSTFSEEGFLQIEVERSRSLLLPEPPWLFPTFFKTLEDLVTALGDVPLMFNLIPDEFQVNDELWQKMTKTEGFEPGERFGPQKRLRRWLEERNIPCLDLLPLLRSVDPLADGQLHVFLRQDTHLNARGNEIVGKALARFIRLHFPQIVGNR